MTAIQTLTDSTWQQLGDKPALILVTNGDGVRGDFVTAFKKAATETSQVIFAEINPDKNPAAAERFNAGAKPIMIGWHCGETLVRKVRPWGSDVVLTIELLEKSYQEYVVNNQTNTINDEEQEPMTDANPIVADNKPVAVTDEAFETDVINYSREMPVLVDFWAEWCGPCRMVAPVLDKLAEEFAGKIRIAKVDTDANPGLSQAFQIMSIPTIMVFKDGVLVFSQPGALPEEAFRQLIDQVIALDVQAAMAEQEKQEQAE
ncbi:MAG: thioredoxin [Aggregatilineales bacterium]